MSVSGSFERIVVPTDFSACAEEAWAVAKCLAGQLGAEVVLVHVLVEAPAFSEGPFTRDRVREVFVAARRWAERQIREWAEAAQAEGIAVRTQIREGVPHQEVVATAAEERADLIVIGTHGRGGVSRALLGSVADRVIRLAPCPVLSVRESKSA